MGGSGFGRGRTHVCKRDSEFGWLSISIGHLSTCYMETVSCFVVVLRRVAWMLVLPCEMLFKLAFDAAADAVHIECGAWEELAGSRIRCCRL